MFFDPPDVPAAKTFDIEGRLEFLEQLGLSRSLAATDHVGKYVQTGYDSEATPSDESEPALNVASNDVLDLARDERVVAAVQETTEEVGVSGTSSRTTVGDTVAHRRLEQELAAARRSEDAITFPSTYAANLGVITALYPNVVFSDENNHISIVEGARASDAEIRTYDHCDPDSLEAELQAQAQQGSTEKWLIITESVYSMDADVAPLETICDLASEYGAWVLVDGAWACGLYEDGGGIVQREGLSDRVDVQVGALSKALASQGGYVAGDENLVAYLANVARTFLFSTALNPPAVSAARTSLEIARESDRPAQLHENASYVRTQLRSMGFEVWGTTNAVPVLVRDTARTSEFAARLRDCGVLVNAVPYPAVPPGTSRIRILPRATHRQAELDRLLDAVETVGREIGLIE